MTVTCAVATASSGSRSTPPVSRPGRALRGTPPTTGDSLVTSLDLPLEQAGLHALQVAMHLAHRNGYPASAAAFTAIDPRNGQVLAMGSLPAFNPNVLSRPFISQAQYAQQGAGDAFINRAISSVFPTGSTFKPIASLAALAGGLITPSSLLGGTGAGGCLTIAHRRSAIRATPTTGRAISPTPSRSLRTPTSTRSGRSRTRVAR